MDTAPPRAAEGLLEYLSTHAVDEDYAFVSARSAESGTSSSPRRSIGVLGAVVMAAFALLVATAAVQTSRNAGSEEQQRRELVTQVDAARDQLTDDRARIAALRAENQRVDARLLANDRAARDVVDQVRLLGTQAGTVAVRGPGVRVRVDDAPGAQNPREMVLDTDLQRLVNGLWQAGAEAVSLNGQRLTTLSTIRLAGDAITVNNHSLRRPYTVLAIGNKDTLPARFAETSSGQAWLDLQRQVGLELSITPVSSLRLPATEVPGLRYANRKAGGTQ